VSEYCHVKEISKELGKGLFSSKNLLKGNYLIYFGEVVPYKSIESKSISMAFGSDLKIDCSKYKSKAYFVNQSCKPNCRIEEWYFYQFKIV